MRSRSTRLALFALLLLQLTLGMPPSFGHDAPTGTPVGGAGMQHCPDHRMGSGGAGLSPHSHQLPHSGHHPPLNHGCCHGSTCLCHCTYPPAVSEPTITGPIAAFTHRVPAAPALLVAVLPSERFRPPIA